MSQLTPWLVYVNAIIAGLIFGIYLNTGININPEDFIMDITGEFVEITDIPQTTSMWQSIKPILIIGGVLSTILEIALIWSMGLAGIVPATFGFFGAFLLVFGFATELGVIILVAGVVTAAIGTKE